MSRRAEHSAACVWVGANAGRRTKTAKAKTADLGNSTVRSYSLVGLSVAPQTLSIKLPNTIHGCKKLDLRRRKRYCHPTGLGSNNPI